MKTRIGRGAGAGAYGKPRIFERPVRPESRSHG